MNPPSKSFGFINDWGKSPPKEYVDHETNCKEHAYRYCMNESGTVEYWTCPKCNISWKVDMS